MRKRLQTAILVVLFIITTFVPNSQAAAAPGIPGSPEFGYGAWIHLDGDQFEPALSAISDLRLHWVAINLNWSQWMPGANSQPNTGRLDQVFKACASSGAAVLISISNPPAWALTASGPNTENTIQLVQWLLNRYGQTLQAVELFPSSNTHSGWGAPPDPAAYATVFSSIRNEFSASNPSLVFVAGGLETGIAATTTDNWTDVDFLRGLYGFGAKEWMTVLSIHSTQLSGDPLNASRKNGVNVLRKYESLRQVMLENQHTNGMLWITLLNFPDGKIKAEDQVYNDPQKQADWLQQGLLQIRSQLYIGVALVQSINPPTDGSGFSKKNSLIQADAIYQPFYTVLKATIQQANPEEGVMPPGRPKTSAPTKDLNKS